MKELLAPGNPPDGLVADLVQCLVVLLYLNGPEKAGVAVPRPWLQAWVDNLAIVLKHLRTEP